MCTVILPANGNPIAVKFIIAYHSVINSQLRQKFWQNWTVIFPIVVRWLGVGLWQVNS